MAYIYKTVPVDGSLDEISPLLLSSKINSLINVQSSQGWDFYQISSVQAHVTPGCLDGLIKQFLPAFSGAGQAKIDIAIFRKEITQQEFADLNSKLQDEVNNDTSKPHPDTHVKCPDCKGLVRMAATKCRHCGSGLKPLI